MNYRKPLTTQGLEFSGFPEGKKRGFKNKPVDDVYEIKNEIEDLTIRRLRDLLQVEFSGLPDK